MKMKRIGPRVGHVAKMLLCRSATAVVNSDCEQFNCMNSIDFTFKYIPVCPLYSLNVNIYILCWIHVNCISSVYFISITISNSNGIWYCQDPGIKDFIKTEQIPN